MSSDSITAQLAAFIAGRADRDATMQRFVAMSLLDWTTVGLAGRDEPVARAARDLALQEGPGAAALLGGGCANPRAAALANGAASHALDYDDTHFGHIGHPSVAVIPAALALAGQVDGARFLDALTVGLETACRVGLWLGRPHYLAGFHQTGTSGAFGATAAACRILGLKPAQVTHALGLTATRAAGLKSQFGSMGKPLNAGFAAEVGVTSALLARAGATSMPDAMESPQGFGPTHAGAGERAALTGLGRDWVFPGVSYKFHACCHGLHAMIEAALQIRAYAVPEQVTSVSIRTNPAWMAVCNQPAPATGLEAKFSYRLVAAMCLAGRDTAALQTFSDEACADPVLVALRDKVTVSADATLAETAANVTVTLGNGDLLEARHDLDIPTEVSVLARRLRQKSDTLLGRDVAERLEAAIANLRSASSVSGYLRAWG